MVRNTLLLTLLVLFAAPAQAWQVRISLGDPTGSLEVSGTDLRIVDGDVGDELVRRGGGGTVAIQSSAAGLVLGGNPSRARRVLVSAVDGLTVAGFRVAGTVEVRPAGEGRQQVRAINELPIERYLLGIVGSEMPPSWPLEALKAQAVAARTYAVKRVLEREEQPYDLESSVLSQVYGGAGPVPVSVRQAVEATRGEIVTFDRAPADALFHACCGGQTASAHEVWGGTAVPYLQSHACTYCADCARKSWEWEVGRGELEETLRRAGLLRGRLRSVTIGRRSPSGRVASIQLAGETGGQAVDAAAFRRAVGFNRLWSLAFTVATKGDRIHFAGQGAGHGVGMCQWGARGMARAGKDYRTILLFYYPGTEIRRLY